MVYSFAGLSNHVCSHQVYFQLENLSRSERPYKSVAALNCIISGCANIWDLDRAYQTFESIESTFGLTPDIHSYNGLMHAFGKLKKVMAHFPTHLFFKNLSAHSLYIFLCHPFESMHWSES